MPKLPSDEVLGRVPSADSGRPFVSLNTSAPGAAMEQVGKGIADLGKGIASGIKSFADDQNDLSEQKAKSWHLTQRVALEKKHDDTEDEEVLKKRQEEEQSLVDQAAAMMGGRAGEKYKLEWAPKVAAYGVKSQDRIAALQKNRDLAEANDWLEMMKDVGSNPDVSEENRLAAIQLGNETFDQMREKGYLNDVQVNERKKAWATDYAYKAFELMKPEEVAMVLATPYTTNDREERAYRYFLSKGWSSVQAAGIVGVLSHESAGMQTKARNPGDGNDGSDSIGLAQWNAERAVRLKNFAASMGRDWHDFDVQLAFVDYELNTTHREAARRLTGATTVRDAASAFTEHYEKPQGTGRGGYDALMGWGDRLKRSSAIAERYAGIAPESMRGRDLAGFLSTDDQRRIMEQKGKEFADARQQTRQQLQVEQSTVKSMLEDDRASVMRTGKPLDNLTTERVRNVMGEEAARQFEQDRVMATRYWRETKDMDTISNKEIGERLNALDPAKNGEAGKEGFARANWYYNETVKRAQTVLKERNEDPAQVADRQPDVAEARQSANINQPETYRALVARRQAAQERLGIAPQARRDFTAAEYTALFDPIDQAMTPREQQAQAQVLVEQLRKVFGDDKDRIERNVQAALEHYKVSKDMREVLARVIVKAGLGGKADQADKQAVDDAVKADAQARANSTLLNITRGTAVGVVSDPETGVQAIGREIAKQGTMTPKLREQLWDNADNPEAIAAFTKRFGAEAVKAELHERPTNWSQQRNAKFAKSPPKPKGEPPMGSGQNQFDLLMNKRNQMSVQ